MSDTLEKRIADALADDGAAPDAIAALITEVEAAAQQADAAAAKARADALDPAVVVDADKVGAAVASAMLVRDRLQAALPRLQQQLKLARERECIAAWRADFENVRAKRDAMVQELREIYPTAIATLVDLMQRIAATDEEVSRINGSAPSGVHDRLHKVEREARGQLLQPDVEVPKELRLPLLDRNGGPIFAWPPPQPSLAAQMASAPVPRGIAGPDWHSLIDERDRQRREESKRLSAFYEEREREAEKRRETELREAREAHRREYGY